MKELADYLDLTEHDARAQWQRVLRRTPMPRQEAFLPIEAILCFGLFFLLDPHRYGGANIHQVPAEAHAIARLLCRTPGSLTSKMLNLEGARPNAGRLEPVVYLRLSADLDLFVHLFSRVIGAARSEGIGTDALPDFLGVEGGAIEVLGQDEIAEGDLEVLFDEQRDAIRQMMDSFQLDERETNRLVEQRARLGQHRFAREVLRNYDHRCGFCGFAPRSIPRRRMLVASHIKPWRVSTNRERLDPRNGVAACPVHDSAFDSGLLAINGEYRIHRSDRLEASLAADEGSEHYFGEAILRSRLLVPEHGAPLRKYVDYHKTHVFAGRAT